MGGIPWVIMSEVVSEHIYETKNGDHEKLMSVVNYLFL